MSETADLQGSTESGSRGRSKTPGDLGLQSKITCPHCWNVFPPQDLLWVSEHLELLGDPVLGPEVAMRFRPSRFDADCKAIDARGMACTRLACPRCHLLIPRQLVDSSAYFVSVVGVPASGKSYFLACMAWELRRQLPTRFRVGFSDADPQANQSLIDYEQTLFLQDDPTRIVALRKTELQGELYDQVKLGEHAMSLPRPFMFNIRPVDGHPNVGTTASHQRLHRVMCLYDNAGEHFQAGMDSSTSPVTQHLAKAKQLLFLYDPTQDARFRAALTAAGIVVEGSDGARTLRVQRQETVLLEAAARIRRQVGLVDGAKHNQPLTVVVPKMDAWEGLLGDSELLRDEPVVQNAVGGAIDAIDVGRVERVSKRVREMLSRHCPELVAAAEQFCREVVYIPVSATGCGPEKDAATNLLGFRPGSIRPRWVTIPLLYGLARWDRGLIGGANAPGKAQASERRSGAAHAAGVKS